MARGPFPIAFPLTSFPGNTSQEAAGRIINATAEPLGPGGPSPAAYHRQPGLSQFALSSPAPVGYRGGLIVNNLSYEVWNKAYTVTSAGAPTLLGPLPGTKHVSIARNQAAIPDVVAVDVDNGAYILSTQALASATATATIGVSGSPTLVAGDVVSITFSNSNVAGFPVRIAYTLGSSETTTTIATGLKNLINANTVLGTAFVSATSTGPVITTSHQGSLGNFTNLTAAIDAVGSSTTFISSVTGTGNESIAIVAFLGGATATVGGTTINAGDTVSITFASPTAPGLPVKVTYVVVAGNTTSNIATGLVALINANANLSAVSITANNAANVITISQPLGNETVTFAPSSGNLSGGAGTPGIVFTGAPLVYNGGGNLPQPNSVCFQDGYFFFTVANGQCFATAINSLQMSALTFITAQSRSDVILLRGIAFSGLLFLFTTGHCEVWQDVAGIAPAFPYARQVVLPFGLLQANAIAGWETGFDDLSWVAQDFGVWQMPYGSLAPQKTSPPDLDRLIEAEHRAGHLIEASVYMFAGKKFWSLQSPSWTWEFNLGTQQWNERWSLSPLTGVQGRWRGTGGHPAFGKWLLGDFYGGALCYIDDQNKTELGRPMLARLESAPVSNFPNRLRVARADFNFTVGSGQATRAVLMAIRGIASGGGIPAQVRITVDGTQQVSTGDTLNISGAGAGVDGSWTATVIDATNIDLQASAFAAATWTGGGAATDVTAPPNVISPQVAISWSDDGGVSWGNPILRSLGQQGIAKTTRIVLNRCGISGPMGRKWRIDVSDPVNSAFMSATQSDSPAKY